MQRHRAIAERELRLQERHDALQVARIEIEPGEESGVPGCLRSQCGGGR
jgi:hypothetical protein